MLVALIILVVALATLAIAVSLFSVPESKYAQVSWSFLLSQNPDPGHFIALEWQNGTWAKNFGPGWHWVWFIRAFGKVEFKEFTPIGPDSIGLVEALDGEPLEEGQVIAEREVDCNNFADGETFLLNGGQKGPQLAFLRPGGQYIINTALFAVHQVPLTEIMEGKTGVQISNYGGEPNFPEDGENVAMPGDKPVYVVKRDLTKKGILERTLGPGKHAINTAAIRVVTTDTTPIPVTMDGDSRNPITNTVLDPIDITTKDGYTIPAKMEVVIRIPAQKAAATLALAGSIQGLINDVIVVILDDKAKTIVSQHPLANLVDNREGIRGQIERELIQALEHRLPVEVLSFRITKLDYEKSPDEAVRKYMDLRTRAVNAQQEALAVEQETLTAKKIVDLEFQRAVARNQGVVARALMEARAAEDTSTALKTISKALDEARGGTDDTITRSLQMLLARPGGLTDLLSGLGSMLTKTTTSQIP